MDMMDCVLSWSEVDLGLPHFLSIYTRDMMDIVLTPKECGNPRSISLEERTQSIISLE
jgi:hypothetical protein